MTKAQLLKKLDDLLTVKGMTRIDGGNGKIDAHDTKDTIQNAIDCLEASNEQMADYLTVLKLKYPNTYNTIINNGDWLTHCHNRLYVYNTAKMILA